MSQRAIISSPNGLVHQWREPIEVLTSPGDRRFVEVVRTQTCNADGSTDKKFDYIMVKEPHYVIMLVLDAFGRVCLTEQVKNADLQPRLECPAGSINSGETPREAACRETREESGHLVDKPVCLGVWVPQTHRIRATGTDTGDRQPEAKRCYAFMAELNGTVAQELDPMECIRRAQPIPLNQAYDMCLTGEIDNGDTRQAILLAHAYMHNQFARKLLDNYSPAAVDQPYVY